MSNTINPMSMLAATALGSTRSGDTHTTGSGNGSWFEAMADAWGKTLDAEAGRIETMSDDISAGNDKPQAITALTAETLKMGFLSNSSHTSLSAVGSALETMARKQ